MLRQGFTLALAFLLTIACLSTPAVAAQESSSTNYFGANPEGLDEDFEVGDRVGTFASWSKFGTGTSIEIRTNLVHPTKPAETIKIKLIRKAEHRTDLTYSHGGVDENSTLNDGTADKQKGMGILNMHTPVVEMPVPDAEQQAEFSIQNRKFQCHVQRYRQKLQSLCGNDPYSQTYRDISVWKTQDLQTNGGIVKIESVQKGIFRKTGVEELQFKMCMTLRSTSEKVAVGEKTVACILAQSEYYTYHAGNERLTSSQLVWLTNESPSRFARVEQSMSEDHACDGKAAIVVGWSSN